TRLVGDGDDRRLLDPREPGGGQRRRYLRRWAGAARHGGPRGVDPPERRRRRRRRHRRRGRHLPHGLGRGEPDPRGGRVRQRARRHLPSNPARNTRQKARSDRAPVTPTGALPTPDRRSPTATPVIRNSAGCHEPPIGSEEVNVLEVRQWTTGDSVLAAASFPGGRGMTNQTTTSATSVAARSSS